MTPRAVLPVLAALLAQPALAACPPGGGDRLVLAAPAAPAARALLGPGAGPLPVVLVQVNGVALPFVLDTGSGPTLLRPGAAAALGLPVDPGRATPVTGIGGTTRLPNAVLREVAIGRRVFRGVSVPVAQGGEDPGGFAGIVGADLLRGGALEIDLPGGRVALHDGPACAAAPPPWPAEAIPLEITREGLPILTVRVNERPARALLDTGAARSVIRRDRAAALGVPEAVLWGPAAGTVYGTGDADAAFHVADGTAVRLTERDGAVLPVVVAPLPASLGVEMVLGQDLLGPRRLLLSYAARTLWLGRPGG